MDLLGKMGEHLTTALSVTSERHRVIVRNLANVNTPHYKAQDLVFQEHLGRAEVTEREGLVSCQDGNNVVMEVEHNAMKKNDLAYKLYITAMSHEVSLMKGAINGRMG